MNDKEIEKRRENLRVFKYRYKIKNEKLDALWEEVGASLRARRWEEHFKKHAEYRKKYQYYHFYRMDLPIRAIMPLKEFVEETFFGIKLKFDVDKSKILEKPFTLELDKSININDELYNYKIILKQNHSIFDIYLYYKDSDSDTWYEFAAVRHAMVIPRWEDWDEWEKAKKLIIREIELQLYKIYGRKIKKLILFSLAFVGGLFLFFETVKYIGLI